MGTQLSQKYFRARLNPTGRRQAGRQGFLCVCVFFNKICARKSAHLLYFWKCQRASAALAKCVNFTGVAKNMRGLDKYAEFEVLLDRGEWGMEK